VSSRLAWVIWFLIPFPILSAEGPEYSLQWSVTSVQAIVEIVGFSAPTLERLQKEDRQTPEWQKLLAVYAESGASKPRSNLPPMLGSYRITDARLRFQSAFPLEHGVNYRAVFRPAGLLGFAGAGSAEIVSTYRLPEPRHKSATAVTQVYPTANVLPANLLKFYIHFSSAMSRGHIYDHIKLIDDAGKAVELPFLEIDQELWNPEMTRLTLFIDPGRIKRGVQPLEEIGPVLITNRSYTLFIQRDLENAEGIPLKRDHRKHFTVGPNNRESLDTAQWRVSPPRGRSRNNLRLRFARPLDHALALRVIRVLDAEDQPVPGEVRLGAAEREWSFTPQKAWRQGRYQIVVETTIEDLAGNNIGKPFEVDLFDDVQQSLSNSTVAIPFEVR
jgi:hypothetical protein